MPLPEPRGGEDLATTRTAALRAAAPARPVGVDREARRVNGMILAIEGDFKTSGRGSFDLKSLQAIVSLMKEHPKGLPSRLSHANPFDDGLSRYLGRVRDGHLGKARVVRDGKEVEVHAARGNLHLSATAFEGNPNGNLGGYILALVEEDPDAISSSLVLEVEEEFRRDAKGRAMLGADGQPLPPIWRPYRLLGSDLVAVGDAVDSLLSTNTPADLARHAALALDRMFAGEDRGRVEASCREWLGRYLDGRFGEPPPPPETPALARHLLRLKEQGLMLERLKGGAG